MGRVIRQSIFTTIISYAGAVVGYLNLFYLYPKFLAPEQVGLLRTLQDAAILFSPFAQFGLAHSIYRYHPHMAKDDKSESGFISLILLLALIGFGLFLIVFKIFEQPFLSYFEKNAHEIIGYSSLVLWLTFVFVFTALLENYSRTLLKNIFPTLLREVVIRLLLSVLVLTYFAGWIDYSQFIIATLAAYVLCLLILVAYLLHHGKLKLSFRFLALPRDKVYAMMGYSLFNFASSAGMILIGKLDSLMVAGMKGLAANAVYTTAFYMATVIEIPKRAMSQISLPLIGRSFEKNDHREINSLYQKFAINQLIVGALLLIGIYINIDAIFSLMPKSETYRAGTMVVVIVGVGRLVDMAFGPSSEIIVLSKYFWFNVIPILLLSGVTIVANNILIPLYGITGAGIGAALALIIFNVAKYFFILFKLKMQPFTPATVKVLVAAGIVLLLNSAIPRISNAFMDILLRSSAVTVVYAILIFLSNASPDGNAFIMKLKKRFL